MAVYQTQFDPYALSPNREVKQAEPTRMEPTPLMKERKLKVLMIEVLPLVTPAQEIAYKGNVGMVEMVVATKRSANLTTPTYRVRWAGKPEELVDYTQRQLLGMIPFGKIAVDGSTIGWVTIGTSMYDQESWPITFSTKWGFQAKAPGYYTVIEDNKKYVHNRKFFDTMRVEVTKFIHAACAAVFCEVAGIPLKHTYPSGEQVSCANCQVGRRLSQSDQVIGDAIMPDIRSKSTTDLSVSGPYDSNIVCAMTGNCPSASAIHTANREACRGEATGEQLVAEANAAEAGCCYLFTMRSTKNPATPKPEQHKVLVRNVGDEWSYLVLTAGYHITFSVKL